MPEPGGKRVEPRGIEQHFSAANVSLIHADNSGEFLTVRAETQVHGIQ